MGGLRRLSKEDIEEIERLVEEASLYCYVENDVNFEFAYINKEVKTVFVREDDGSRNPVTHDMLKDLSKQVKKIHPDYLVGIIFTDIPSTMKT